MLNHQKVRYVQIINTICSHHQKVRYVQIIKKKSNFQNVRYVSTNKKYDM